LVLVLTVLVALLVAACGGGRPPTATPAPIDVAVGAADGASLGVARGPAAPAAAREDDVAIPIRSDDAQRGSRTALATIVLFSDFQCPFCGRLAPTLDRVLEAYGDDVRLVFKNHPLAFHTHAKLAAQVGQAVLALKGPEAFWRFHDLAFRRQEMLSPEAVRAWAVSVGVDAQELEAGLARSDWLAKVDADEQLAVRLGSSGTPGAFINGIALSGAQPFEKWKEVLDAEIAKAKVLVDEGVARSLVYRVRTAENLTMKPAPRDSSDDDKDDTKTINKVPVGKSPVRGSPAAPVTIIMFSDFQCPYCKRVEPTLEQLRAAYGAKLRFVWKDEPLPFHPRARPAAELARFARALKGDAAFWDVHDRLFASQPRLEDADLEVVARAAGLDVKVAMASVRANAFAKAIDDDLDLGDDVGAAGTPHFFINGRRLVGAQPLEKFKSVIDEELTKAEALVRAGIPVLGIYDALTKDGKEQDPPDTKTVAASPSAPFRGPPNAKVVIQQFADFQCPFCERAEPTLDELLKAYPTQVKIVWRDLPLPMHPNAPLAAEAAREAFAQKGNEGFAKMRKLLFQNQRGEGLAQPALEGYAKTLGLDAARFRAALDRHIHASGVAADDKAAHDAGISGTPAFVVGTYYVSGAQPLAKFRKLVERTLSPPPPAANAPAPKVTAVAAAGPVAASAGLVVHDLVVGKGREAKSGDTISVHYTGTLTDGSVFDSSKKRGTPFEFELGKGRVIKGWEQGLVGLKVGGRRKLTIPPDLAYGDRGMPPVIPPRSVLVFDVELVDVK
jgi:protein-disulfide isomerase